MALSILPIFYRPLLLNSEFRQSIKKIAIMEQQEKSKLEKSKEKTPKEIYFEQLRNWVNQANISQCFPYFLISNYPQLFQINSIPQTASPSTQPNNQQVNQPNNQRRATEILDPARQEEIINQNGGYEYVIPFFWKRLVAEVIDIFIIFVIKLMMTFAIVDFFDIDINIDLMDFDSIKNSLEDDYSDLLSFTSELIILEIVTKIAVCIYETLWTAYGQATPGKMLMGIRIVHVEAVVLLDQPQPGAPPQPQHLWNNNGQQMKALLFPATNPGYKRAFFRAVTKNIIVSLLFPMCFLMFFFKHNRTIYDIMTKTIVIEDNMAAPVLRRR